MRFFTAALSVAALISTAVASPQDSYNSVSSATQVVTITRTVSRVVQTEYMTKTPSAYPTTTKTTSKTTSTYTPAPTGVLPPPYGGNNGTAPIASSGGVPSPSSSSTPEPPIYPGAAGNLRIEALGAAALAGIVGFLAV